MPSEDLRRALANAAPIVAGVEARMAARPPAWIDLTASLAQLMIAASVVIGLISLVMAALLGGPAVMSLAGYALVAGDGPASRVRAMWRAVIAWSPAFIGQVAYYGLGAAETRLAVAVGCLGILVVATALILWRPGRSLADWIAGTRIVPR